MHPFTDPVSARLAGSSPVGPVAPPTAIEESQADFASILGRAKTSGAPPEQRAREAAEQLVAVAMVQPVLKGMRENTWAAAPFAPNQAERMFRGMMDAEFAQRLVKSQRWGLVDAVARRVLREQGTPPQTPAAEPQHPNG